ncbi:MAG: hypothetical protein M3328_08745 [Chloroflexota bacterium]|nr:hypothetical protein [Chloroflexota bacterium]
MRAELALRNCPGGDAGRAAEEVALGEITTGAEKDLVEATWLARRMVTRWGMGSLVALEADDEQPFLGYELSRGRDYGDDTANRIDADVRTLPKALFEYARQLLAEHRAHLDGVVQKLLQEETVTRDTLARVIDLLPAEPR